jgi:hypothetical protein
LIYVSSYRERANDGEIPMFDAQSIAALAEKFRGDLIKPGDAAYDEARAL